MADWLVPLAFALLAWFFSTGAILWLDQRPADTHGASLVGATILSGIAFAAVLVSAGDASVFGAYTAFVATIAIWGWHEMAFLMGFVTGPRRLACPDGVTGWRRFRFATATLIHHEIALALTAILLILLTWGGPNPLAGTTFLLLFVMRLSTKFNIFLGVPHLADAMMPPQLDYLRSYFRKAPGNPLMPVSALGSVLVAAWFAQAALQAPAASGAEAGYVLLFTLAALAIIEHAFLLLPVRDSALWTWAMPKHISQATGLQKPQRTSKGSDDGL